MRKHSIIIDQKAKGTVFVLFCVLGFSSPCFSQQFPSDFWNKGKVIYDGADTVQGLIKYNLQNDLIQLQVQGRVETLTPRKAVFFEIFDQTVKRYRQFYSLPYSASVGQYKAPVFFELLAEGKLTLLCREALEYRAYSPYNSYYGTRTSLVLVNHFFFLKEDGSIQAFTGNRNDLLDMMGPQGDDVKRYAREKRLNFDSKYGFAGMVEYYNRIAK